MKSKRTTKTAKRKPGALAAKKRTLTPRETPPVHRALDAEMMGRALDLARGAAGIGEVPIGAVVYETETGRILGEGANTRETRRDPLGHAELAAIAQASRTVGDWRLNHCTLVVTLEPCPMCAGAIVNARLGRVVFGASDPKAGAIETLYSLVSDPRLNHRAEIVAGVCSDESAALLKEFFAGLRVRRTDGAAKPKV